MNGLLLLTANTGWAIVAFAFVFVVLALAAFVLLWPFTRTPQH